jgi:outer membrane protein assembly factor BamB
MSGSRILGGALLISAFCVDAAYAHEWYNYRNGTSRDGIAPYASNLSNPAKVGALAVKWSFPAQGAVAAFKASPIIVNDTAYIGSVAGYFYALDAVTGKLLWQYPKPPAPPLIGHDAAGWANYGIQASASYWDRKPNGAVVFGAQDGATGPSGADGHLYALDAKTGALIWKSAPVSVINGVANSTSQLHQRIAYSSPLLFDGKAYVGIHDDGDNPIQIGKIIAVDLATGQIDAGFKFDAVGPASPAPGTRGGGIWNAPATDGDGVYFTTGNTCNATPCQPEPKPNHGLSMIRVDKSTGKIIWAWQPVPYKADADPDWAAGAAVASTSCHGKVLVSVQKDGWSYAVEAGNATPAAPKVLWQFPPTGYGANFLGVFGEHGDTDYKQPGAAWNDVLVIKTGGESRVHDGPPAGYGKLHALNVCATTEKTRVRWIADIPNTTAGSGYSMGAPTVEGGVVFIGTDKGHLVVLGDPSIVPSAGTRCSNIDYTTAASCHAAGYVLVPIPKVLADVALPDNGNAAGLRNEPALAKGRVFVGTLSGHVYMLEP